LVRTSRWWNWPAPPSVVPIDSRSCELGQRASTVALGLGVAMADGAAVAAGEGVDIAGGDEVVAGALGPAVS
jgi:hypothetical protein